MSMFIGVAPPACLHGPRRMRGGRNPECRRGRMRAGRPLFKFFKFVAACRRFAIIGRFAATRCCVAANAPVGGVIIGCCTSARLQFEWIVLRSGQRIIASFRQKRQIGAALARRAHA
ncbi:hypothetical protein GPU89_17195 [Burkholderia cepacia]|nr:hypothetical protein [Burkholderia cepacia]